MTGRGPSQYGRKPPTVVSLGSMLSLDVRVDRAHTTKPSAQQITTPIIMEEIDKPLFIEKDKVSEQLSIEPVPCSQKLLENSSNLRLLHKNNRNCLRQILVLSAEFLLNEFSFWNEPEIDQSALKNYRKLSSENQLLWLVKKENTL